MPGGVPYKISFLLQASALHGVFEKFEAHWDEYLSHILNTNKLLFFIQ